MNCYLGYFIVGICIFFNLEVSAFRIEVGTLDIPQKAKDYVNQVLDNNRLSYGPFLKKFEQEFAEIHDSLFAITSNSGTSSLQVALQTLKEIYDWQDGDEVIVPAVTFIATSNIVLHNRMIPVFVDVEKEFYGIDPTLIESKITNRTRAIIPVHLFGLPCDMHPICDLAKKYNLKIIEDSCETMFASYEGKKVGSLGDIGCFSTYIAHLLTAGIGGFSITNNTDYAIKMRSLVNHGRDSIYLGYKFNDMGEKLSRDKNKEINSEEIKEIIARRFNFISVGHSFRLTEMEGAIGLAQLETYESMIKKRQFNANYLIESLKKFEDKIQLPKIRKKCTHSFMMFPIVLKSEAKTKLVNFLELNGIETRDMLPLINQPIYQNLFNLKEEDYPVASWINKNGFYIGCHQGLEREGLDYIVKVFEEYFRG